MVNALLLPTLWVHQMEAYMSQHNDESNWVYISFHPVHPQDRKQQSINHFSNLPNDVGYGMGNFSATVKEETYNEEAMVLFMHQQSYDHATILKTHSINKPKEGQLVAMTERVPPLSFQEWLNYSRFNQW